MMFAELKPSHGCRIRATWVGEDRENADRKLNLCEKETNIEIRHSFIWELK
jgi:hypothetical protein